MSEPTNEQGQNIEPMEPLHDADVAGETPEQLLAAALAGPEPDGSQIIPLPSGALCRLRPGKGRDLLAAQRMAGTDPHQVMYGIIAALAEFDGQKKVLEDVLDMPLGDVMTLMGKVNDLTGGDFLPSTPGPSSTSRP